MKRAAANDPASIFLLANHYHLGRAGFQQDYAKAMELYTRAAELGCSKAHSHLADVYYDGGDLKKTRTLRPQLWQETNLQDASLESWSHNLETWNEL